MFVERPPTLGYENDQKNTYFDHEKFIEDLKLSKFIQAINKEDGTVIIEEDDGYCD